EPRTLTPEPSLSPKEKLIHDQALISVLKQIHDDLDAAVFDAYGWPANLTDDQLLERLVALNHQRHAEEQQGHIRYLRPDFQNPAGSKNRQSSLNLPAVTPQSKIKTQKSKLPWPK